MEIAPVVTIAKVVKEDDEVNKADKEHSSQQPSSQPGIKIKDFARMPEAPQPPQGDAAAVAALGARRKLSTSTNRLGPVHK